MQQKCVMYMSHTCTYTPMRAYIHIYTCTYIQTPTHTHVHMHTHLHMHIIDHLVSYGFRTKSTLCNHSSVVFYQISHLKYNIGTVVLMFFPS